MIRTFLRRHASIFGGMTGLLAYMLIIPGEWSFWFRLPVALVVAVGVTALLSIKPARRY